MEPRAEVFLWGFPPPLPELGKFNPRSDRWWVQYQRTLHLSPVAQRELAQSSRDIAALLPDPLAWGDSPRPFKGLVVGAVQSGKTASMMGVAAVALDQGYRLIVVLSGGKDDLRQQTARRFNSQLLRQSDTIPNSGGSTTLGTPQSAGPLGGFAPPFHLDANHYSLLQAKMFGALRKKEPCVIVVKKNVASLRDLQGALQSAYSAFGVAALPMLVFDDECDEASVDSEDATIPSAIANLWRRPSDDAPLGVYLGYTATSAANLLQHKANALYPEHAAYLLRYPGEFETAIQFADPNPDAWYSGGDCYYNAFGDEPGETANFLISATVDDGDLDLPVELNPSLQDALRGYFVGGAYRLAMDPSRTFESAELWPLPHSMLVQTSTETDEHIRWANGIAKILGGYELNDGSFAFDVEFLLESIVRDEAQWRDCYEKFERSRERIYSERPHPGVHYPVTWTQVAAKLRSVFEHARLKVINSDVSAGSSLDYAARLQPTGEVHPPQDTFVIVVGGSKLSRGLTLEGLAISYFVRWPSNPTEDTVLQMSRWFGYRGKYLEFCRVFTTISISENLRQMHENDVDLRFQLSKLMIERKSPKEATLIIRANPRARPTSKMGVGLLVDVAYSPFTAALRNLEVGELSAVNEAAARKFIERVESKKIERVKTQSGVQRGVLSRGWTAEEVADLLDQFQFSKHNPSNENVFLKEHHRMVAGDRSVVSSFSAVEDPYQVAAYLRAWSKHAVISGEGGPPSFNLGVAWGEMEDDSSPFDFPLVNRQITETGRAVSGWTGRSTNWQGDAFFDDPPSEFRMQGSFRRAKGADALLLLYVVHKNAIGRTGNGIVRSNHTPMIAISIPEGGPSFRHVSVKGENEIN